MTTKETKINFCISQIAEEITSKGEKLPAVNYCTKEIIQLTKKEVNGEIQEELEVYEVAMNYDFMLQQILQKYGVN